MRSPAGFLARQLADVGAAVGDQLAPHLPSTATVKRNFPVSVRGQQQDDYRVHLSGEPCMVIDKNKGAESRGEIKFGTASVFECHFRRGTDIRASDRVIFDVAPGIEYEIIDIGAPVSNEPLRRVTVSMPRTQVVQ